MTADISLEEFHFLPSLREACAKHDVQIRDVIGVVVSLLAQEDDGNNWMLNEVRKLADVMAQDPKRKP